MTRLLFPLMFSFIFMHVPSAHSQLVNAEFTDVIYKEDFETDKGDWKVLSNAENLFIIQEGNYILNRKNKNSAYSIFPIWKNNRNAFEINMNLRFDFGTEKDAAAGLIFMAQEDGSGAFVLEINGQKQYRLKQLVGVNFKILTGNPKLGGWVYSEHLLGSELLNHLQIRMAERNYDVYINRKYIFSFTELAYKSGNIGIAIGPGTQARIDNFTVYGLSAEQQQNLDAGLEYMSPAAMKSEIIHLRKENQQLRDSLSQTRKELQKRSVKVQKSK